MGNSSSIPHPLVEVHAPSGRVLVPAGSNFSVYPPHHKPLHQHQHSQQHIPVYDPTSRRRLHRPIRRPPVEYEGYDEDDESESGVEFDMMPSPGMGGRGGGFGRGRGGMGGIGGLGRGRGGGMRGGMGFDMMDRPHSAPGMGMGGMGGMGGPGGLGGGMMGSGGMMGGGMGMSGPGGMEGGIPGGMGPMGMPPGAMGGGGGMNERPPGFNSMQSMPPPYTQHRAPSPLSSASSHRSVPLARHTSRRPPGEHERIPMGLYAKARSNTSPKTRRSRTGPTAADRLNRGQPSNRKLGPSGKEWLKGDDFLDACVCTTGCTCRKGHRVLYRSRDDPNGSDSDSSSRPRYGSGEIRYILKTDLGRDCDDHFNCKPKGPSSSSSNCGSERISKKEKKEEKRRKEEFKDFKQDMLEALDVKLKARSSKVGSSRGSVRSPQPPFAGLGGGINGFGMIPTSGSGLDPLMAQKMAMGGMGGGAIPGGIDPLMAQKMGLGADMGVTANPYAMPMPGMPNRLPGMGNPMRSQQMPRLGMQDLRTMMPGPMGHMGGGIPFDDDISIAGMNPYLTAGIKPKDMRFISPGRKPSGFGDMGMDELAIYGRGGGGGRRGMMGNRGRGRGGYAGREDLDRRFGQRAPRKRSDNDSGEDGFGGMAGSEDSDRLYQATRIAANKKNQGRDNTGHHDRSRQPRAETEGSEYSI